MRAITITPGAKNSVKMCDVPAPKQEDACVTVRVVRTGLCGTDAEINAGIYGEAPPGDKYLILGHENFGVVERAGAAADGIKPGDYVVSTVRRPCGKCANCAAGEMDLCMTGDYTERGIKGKHGFMAERYTESAEYLVKIPAACRDVGVLLEPMSIVEKGIDHTYLIQRRMVWRPRMAWALGAGPVGLLAAAVLRTRGLEVFVAGREAESDPRAEIVRGLGAQYACVKGETLADLLKQTGKPDLIIEATGASSVAFASMQLLAPNGVLCLLSVTGGHTSNAVPTDVINQDLVLRNNVVFGSVNANPRHFRKGVEDFEAIEEKWPGVLQRLITTRLPWEKHSEWFNHQVTGIKTTLEISPDG
ncbi:MAG: glucose 1-dehydrogenase [Terriglobia bacterium]